MEQYDVLVIGLGPAGMAVTAMASAMGLKVCAIERERIGGECGNVGCIPSKGLLRLAKHRPLDADPIARVDRHVSFIRDAKMGGVLKKAEIIKGQAAFLDKKTVAVADRRLSDRRRRRR